MTEFLKMNGRKNSRKKSDDIIWNKYSTQIAPDVRYGDAPRFMHHTALPIIFQMPPGI